jgi:hypothetical protein
LYALPTSPPANTGDIHQNELPFPFAAKEFERRLQKLRVDFIFENEEEVEVRFCNN